MEPTVVVNGKEYPFVTEGDLTLGEAAEIERITGQGYDLSQIGALGLMALVYVSVKRLDPTVKLEDLEVLRGGDIDVRVQDGEPLPPPSSVASNAHVNSGSDGSPDGSEGSQEDHQPITGTPV